MSDPYNRPTGKSRSEARVQYVSKVAEVAAVLRMNRAAKRASEETRAQLMQEAERLQALHTKQALPMQSSASAATTALPRGNGHDEARMMRDMFQVGGQC